MKRNKIKVPGGCTGVAGWERLEGCWLDRGPGCAAGRGERSTDEQGRRTAEEVAGWNRGIAGTRNHWSWEGTANPGKRHWMIWRDSVKSNGLRSLFLYSTTLFEVTGEDS